MSIPIPTSSADPFGNNSDATSWTIVNGSPQILETDDGEIGNVFLITSAKGLTYCTDDYLEEEPGSRVTSVEMEGLFFPIELQAGKLYTLTGFMRADNSPDDISIILANGFDDLQETLPGEFAPPCNLPPNSNFIPRSFGSINVNSDHQRIFKEEDFNTSLAFVPFRACFTPNDSYSQMWFRIKDDDVQLTPGAPNAGSVATWMVGGLQLKSFEDDSATITYNRTESDPDGRPYYVHNMLPPITVADEIILDPMAPFGINVLENDEPIILVGNEIVIKANPDFDFTVDSFFDPSVENRLLIRAAVDEDEFYSYNDCSNYFSLDQMDVRTEANFLGGWHYDSLGILHFGNEIDSFNNKPYVYTSDCKRCLIAPKVFMPGGDDPYYNAWSPLAIGYPHKYNAIEYKLLAQTTYLNLLHEDEGKSCIGEEMSIVYWGEGADFNDVHINIEWFLSNCKDSQTWNGNVALDWSSPNGFVNMQDRTKRWEKGELGEFQPVKKTSLSRVASVEESEINITGVPIQLSDISEQTLKQLSKFPGLNSQRQYEQPTNVSITIQPNPSIVETQINVHVKEKTYITTVVYTPDGVQILNLGGIFTDHNGRAAFNLDTSRLNSGMYLVEIKTAQAIYTKKLIVL